MKIPKSKVGTLYFYPDQMKGGSFELYLGKDKDGFFLSLWVDLMRHTADLASFKWVPTDQTYEWCDGEMLVLFVPK